MNTYQILEEYSDILTFKEFKEVMKFSRNKCYDILNSGTIKALRIGKEFRIPKVNIIKYLLNEPQ